MKTHKNALAVLSFAFLLGTTAYAQVPGIDLKLLPDTGKTSISFSAMPDSITTNIAGSDSYWDYSRIKRMGNDSVVTELLESSGETGSTQYPMASIAAVSDDGKSVDFLTVNHDSVLFYGNMGAAGAGSKVIYTDPILLMKYPFNFNDDYFDDFEGNVTQNGASYHRVGTIYVQMDAYGSMKFPHVTYRKVLRVFRQQEFTDSNLVTSEYTYGTIKTYTYYLNGYYNPVMSIKKEQYISNAGSDTMETVTYYDRVTGPDVGVKKLGLASLDGKLFPNPSSGLSQLQFSAPAGTKATLIVSNMLGQEVQHREVSITPGINTLPIDLSSANKGLYLIRLSSPQGELSQKMLVR